MSQTNLHIPFRQKPLLERKEKFEELMKQNPEKIPIIFETSKKSKVLQKLNLRITVSKTMKFSKVAENYRKLAKLSPSETIFFHCGKSKTIAPSSSVEEIYSKCRNAEDGFLYIECAEIDAWGF